MMGSGSEKRKRDKLVALRLTQAEREELQKRCDDYGVSVGEMVRVQCLDQPMPRRRVRRASTDVEAVARTLAELGKVGSNVNQIARVLNARGDVTPPELQEALQAVTDIRAACMEALGRKP